jgi:hypothetical protein
MDISYTKITLTQTNKQSSKIIFFESRKVNQFQLKVTQIKNLQKREVMNFSMHQQYSLNNIKK